MSNKKLWKIGLVVIIAGMLAFGGAFTTFGLAETGKGITPVLVSFSPPLGPDPDVDDVEAPCDQVSAFKIDLGYDEDEEEPIFEEGVPITFSRGDDGTESVGPDVDFSVTIVRNADGTFDFYGATQPVNNVWVKGGPNGYLFQYYPEYDPGVYDDTGLYSPVPGWSHITFYYCEGQEELTVSKTVVTSFIRTHDWDIEKEVTTEKEDFIEEIPKIWLELVDDEELATWKVNVIYEGFTDSYSVSGTVTIENTGTLSAVITGYVDLLGGESIDVDWDGWDGESEYTLAAGEILEGTYSEEGYFEGVNEITVTTTNDSYSEEEDIVWSEDPDEEINGTITILDDSEFLDDPQLGTLSAGESELFEYSDLFRWVDYEVGSYTFENTATIEETGQSASATLKVNVPPEVLVVSKTVETSFNREHFWDIDKSVDTENGYELDDVAKIWLYIDGSGNEKASWTVDVTYEGFEDSDFNVSGTVSVENTGTIPAVITGYEDLLGGVSIDVDWDGWDGESEFTLAAGETLTGTYSEEGYFEGENEITITTTKDSYVEDADIIWGDPDEVTNETVTIVDDSDLFGELELGTLTAPNGDTFTYDKDFAWVNYEAGSYTFNNTATIVETGQSASAILKVNVQGYTTDTAYAKSDDAVDFIPTFANWGWTNPIEPGEYTWDLWAGAAQCDTDKGTLVGSVAVVYDEDGYVTVTYNLDASFILMETHVYAGYSKFPQVSRGRILVYTVAPGQYKNDNPFDGSEVYVIAHAVVGIPDPDFGP